LVPFDLQWAANHKIRLRSVETGLMDGLEARPFSGL
jgi:hypothetical protein